MRAVVVVIDAERLQLARGYAALLPEGGVRLRPVDPVALVGLDQGPQSANGIPELALPRRRARMFVTRLLECLFGGLDARGPRGLRKRLRRGSRPVGAPDRLLQRRVRRGGHL